MSELQRKIGLGSWVTVYSGTNRTWSDNNITYDPNGNTPVYFRARWKDSQNKWSLWSDLFNTKMINGIGEIGVEKSVNGNKEKPQIFELIQNYPNPFNPVTKISYSIKEGGLVLLKVFDLLGNEILVLVNETKPAGVYKTEFNAASLPSGVYIYSLQVNDFFQNQKMILLK